MPFTASDEQEQPAGISGLSGQILRPAAHPGSPPRPDPHAHEGEPIVTREDASIFLQSMYPACPAKVRRKMLKRFDRSVRRGRIGKVVGIVVSNWVRHQRTAYEALIRGPRWRQMPREQARMLVAEELEAVVRGFREGAADTDAGYLAIKNAFQTRRMLEGKLPAITETENAAITAYLATWLVLRRRRDPP